MQNVFLISCRHGDRHVLKIEVLPFRDSTDMKQRAEKINKSKFDRLGAKLKKQMIAKPYEGLVRSCSCCLISFPFLNVVMVSLFCVPMSILLAISALKSPVMGKCQIH